MLLAGCATLAPGSPANAARRPDQTAAIQAVAKMARRGRLEDLAVIERKLHLGGMAAALKWEGNGNFADGQWARFTPRSDSPIDMVYLHRRQQGGFIHPFRDTFRLLFRKDRCVSREAAEAAFGQAFEVTMVPPQHDGAPPYPDESLDLSGAGGRDVHLAFEGEGCEIILSWPSRPLK
jgi:hypothetical protein